MADERSPRLMLLDDSEEVFELPEGRTRIGRAPGNEMRLEDKTVSRFHCHVVRSGREVRVEDTESHNSTRVNGRHAAETPLHDGDVLRVGRLKLRYCDSRNDSSNGPEEVVARPAMKRARYAASKSGPALFPLLFFLIAVLGLSWLFIASSFTARKKPSPESSVLASRDDRGLNSALLDTQRQLQMQNMRLDDVRSRFDQAQASARAIEKDYQLKLEALRREYEDGEAVSKDKAIFRQMISLESTIRELQEQREADRQLFKSQLEEATQDMAAGGSGTIAGMNRSRMTSRTGVSKLQPTSALSKKEVASVVEKLQRAVENYASVDATPDTLEPELSALSVAGGEAAGGLLSVLGHARDLLKGIDDNIAFLKRRTDKLLADAGAAGGSTSEGSAKKKQEGSNYKAGPELEQLQRALELSDRKITIKKAQRERLVALVDAVKATFGRVTDPRAVRHFLTVFARDRDVGTRLAILSSLRAAASPEVIPVLLKRFTAQDETVRQAVRETLIVLSGKDLGGNKRDWEQWWAKQRL